jgi:hypothetical protein
MCLRSNNTRQQEETGEDGEQMPSHRDFRPQRAAAGAIGDWW